MKYSLAILLTGLAFALGSCLMVPAPDPAPTGIPSLQSPLPTDDPGPSSPITPLLPSLEGAQLGLTYQRPDGNRLVEGRGSLAQAARQEIPLPGEAAWLVAVPYQGGSLWTAVLKDGSVVTVLVRGGQSQGLDLDWGPLPPGTPPLVIAWGDQAQLIGPPSLEASILTHPVLVSPDPARLVYIEREGDLVLLENGFEIGRLAAQALPDARLLVDERGRLLFLSAPTDRYAHGVLGDSLEAGSISLVDTDSGLALVKRIEIPVPGVAEGISPIWADLDGDGEREILVTVSDPEQGARLALYREDGELLAEGPAASQGFRWRHQLAALPLDGGSELAVYDVLRPHLDALFEVYRWRGDYLTVMEVIPGYSSHSIGSRNLDQTLAGDLDGDGQLEVVVPSQEGAALSGLFYRNGAMGAAWSLDLGGKLTSNLAAVTLPDGSLAWGAGVGQELVIYSIP